ncbi:MAG TPA: hypothetical protein PLK90_05840 [Clostridiales bacterium]|nr:hypothetical protein [Clostridiales bacterium]HQP69905.1 hypothetical protein [Clostridiales bacterium]
MKKNLMLLLGIIIYLNAETLFEVKDASNNKVLDVSTDGLRVLNGTDTLMVISTDGIRAYIQKDTKGLSRSFCISTASSKDGDTKAQNKVFEIAKDEGATFYNPSNSTDKIFSISKNNITANVNPGLNRDFVINDQAASGKAGGGNLMKISNDEIFETVNDSTMLWYKQKNAFRIGYVSISDPDSVGQASFSSGYKSIAMGRLSFASGYKNIASGICATAMGTLTKAQAISSTAMGSQTTASGYNSTSAGWLTTAQSLNEFAVGNLNNDWGSPSTWVDTDPLFVVGNGLIVGQGVYDKKNAFTVLKNGNVSIGNIVPNSKLDVAGDVRINDNSLYLRGPNDINHGLRYQEYWGSNYINGPAIFGYEGGALGTVNGSLSLKWDDYGTVTIPQGNFIVNSGGLRVSSGTVYAPSMYSTTSIYTKKDLYIDSQGKLCVAAKGDEENLDIQNLYDENKKLKEELSDIRIELEEIRRILNK